MEFPDALKALKEGKKVRRSSFYKNGYLILEANHVIRKTPEGECYTYTYKVDDGDLLAEDWEIVEPKKVQIKKKTVEYITCSNCGKEIDVKNKNTRAICECKNEMVLERENELTVEEAKYIFDIENLFDVMYFPMRSRSR